jgi:anti-anti-sigma regulatory factor
MLEDSSAAAAAPEAIVEQHIHIAGEFELVVVALLTLRSTITVIESSDSHLLFTIPEGGAGIARPGEGDTVDVVVRDPHSRRIAEHVAAALAAVLDFPVALQRQLEAPPPDNYASNFDPQTQTLILKGEIDETDVEQLRNDVHLATAQFTRSTTIDLSEVTFLTSRAIGALVVAQETARSSVTEIALRTTTGSITDKILTILSLPHQNS